MSKEIICDDEVCYIANPVTIEMDRKHKTVWLDSSDDIKSIFETSVETSVQILKLEKLFHKVQKKDQTIYELALKTAQEFIDHDNIKLRARALYIFITLIENEFQPSYKLAFEAVQKNKDHDDIDLRTKTLSLICLLVSHGIQDVYIPALKIAEKNINHTNIDICGNALCIFIELIIHEYTPVYELSFKIAKEKINHINNIIRSNALCVLFELVASGVQDAYDPALKTIRDDKEYNELARANSWAKNTKKEYVLNPLTDQEKNITIVKNMQKIFNSIFN